MDEKQILEIVIREMRAYGNAWRTSWAGFDGRTLRDQLNGIAAWAASSPTEDYTEGTEFYKEIEEECFGTNET